VREAYERVAVKVLLDDVRGEIWLVGEHNNNIPSFVGWIL
jgi:hypothetical protein